MPKVNKDEKYFEGYTEQDVQKPLDAIKNGVSERNAAAEFKVARATLQFRTSEKFKEKVTHAPDPILSNQEEIFLTN